ncbi:MAG TPA: OmpA family protein [Candidatus Omnitrophota bacterium]|nr:OmpA family protein [Candidatus Omnitrophota bacterium]
MKKTRSFIGLVVFLSFFLCQIASGWELTQSEDDREKAKEDEKKQTSEEFSWWPTDAKPAPVKDEKRGGYWWMPTEPGKMRPWGNRGYLYVYKIIFDYKEEDLPPAKPAELRASLLIKKIVKNVKIYFDYNKSDVRDDAVEVLESALKSLKKNPETTILITGNCDVRGSEEYNNKLGKKRGEAVKSWMLENGIAEDRILIVSRGKLDAVAHVTDLVGMQKDRNAQFMVAEVEEVMIPAPGQAGSESAVAPVAEGATLDKENVIIEDKKIEEKEETIEGAIKVSTREYVIKEGDSLWTIAKKELGNGNRWEYLYEVNKDRIKDPNKLKAGKTIVIPVE